MTKQKVDPHEPRPGTDVRPARVGKLRTSAYLDLDGREMPSPLPVAPPVGYKKRPSLSEQIREMVRSEHLRRAAVESGMETFEEADDFDVPDDEDPASPYEEADFEPDPRFIEASDADFSRMEHALENVFRKAGFIQDDVAVDNGSPPVTAVKAGAKPAPRGKTTPSKKAKREPAPEATDELE